MAPTADVDAMSESAEGKMLRPALCLLAAGALGEVELERYARLAAAYEIIHIASLTHDDVLDHASLRRGQDSLNALWNNHAAVLGGDYLVARALELIAEYDSIDLIAAALGAMRRMAEGELRFFGQDAAVAPLEDCLALAESKTAGLFAAACAAPAIAAARDARPVLHAFGLCLGMAFQLMDDLLDLTQSSETLGKPACGDVTEGKHTMPLFLLRKALSSDENARLNAFRGAVLTDADRVWIREMTLRHEVDRQLIARAETYLQTAIEQLDSLDESVYRDAMIELARFVLIRLS